MFLNEEYFFYFFLFYDHLFWCKLVQSAPDGPSTGWIWVNQYQFTPEGMIIEIFLYWMWIKQICLGLKKEKLHIFHVMYKNRILMKFQ